ncbi:MAG: HAD family hydrolase [Elusimicrobiota bacterium]
MSGRWAVFLDRDGALIDEVGLITKAEQMKILPGVPEGLKRLSDGGAFLVIATNQPVIARGMIEESGLQALHEGLVKKLGSNIDAVYYCPHHPERHHPDGVTRYRIDCECRKPKPGMLAKAATEHNIDLGSSFIVGDSTRDIGAGRAAGCRTILLKTGFAGGDGTVPDAKADFTANDFAEAAEWILSQRSSRSVSD